jgi:hypothetical protein
MRVNRTLYQRRRTPTSKRTTYSHKKILLQSHSLVPRRLLAVFLCFSAVLVALGIAPNASLNAQHRAGGKANKVIYGTSDQNDVSPALRDLPPLWPPKERKAGDEREQREANWNPKLPLPLHVDQPDPVIQDGRISAPRTEYPEPHPEL